MPAGCQSIRALQDVGDVVVSPDGKNVYASSTALDAIVAFNRNTATGVLAQKDSITGCITSDATVASPPHSCNLIPTASALDGVTAIAISPDGENVYAVTNTGIVTTLNRTGDGTLSFNEISNCCSGSGAAVSVTVSPDGASVYAVGPWFNGMVEWLTRVTAPGATHGDLAHGNFYQGPSSPQQNLGNSPSEVEVTPDGKELLIATGAGTNAVLGWDRAPSGALTPSATPSRCFSNSDLAGTCQVRPGVGTPQSLAFADGGATILVGSQQSLTTVQRDPSTGNLAPDAGNCFGYPTSAFSGCATTPGASCCATFYPARDVVSAPDGKNVYLGTESGNPSLWGFSRAGGALALQPTPLRCVSVTAADTCETFRQGNRIQAMSVSNDGRNVYAGGNSRIWAFAADRPPVCQNVSASTAVNTAVTVTLNCSDPDGEPVTYEKASDPARGSVAGVRGNQVSYAPQIGTSGTDSFTYRAVSAGVPSDPATVTVDVSPPASAGPPAPGRVIASTVSPKWSFFRKFTIVRSLTVKGLPAGAKVVTTCKAKPKKLQKRCPYKSRTVTARKAKLELGKPFAKRKLPVGTKIKITTTAPGLIGRAFTYTVRKSAKPALKLQCLPPGAKKPGKCS